MQLGNEVEPHGEFVSAVVVSYMDSRGDTVWKNKENNFCGYIITIHLN